MATTLNTTFKLKRGTAARWAEVNPILEQGEPGFVYDENRLKVGDGKTPWNDLPYIGDNKNLVVNANTHYDFPAIGDVNIIYKASQEKQLYQWNESNYEYELLLSNNLVTHEQLQEVLDKIEIPEMALEEYATKAYAQELFNKMLPLTNEEILEICK